MLQMASPDALIRLQRTVLAEEAKKLSEMYFSEQCHGSIVQFLQHHLQAHTEISDGLLIQVYKVYLLNIVYCSVYIYYTFHCLGNHTQSSPVKC